MKPTHAGILAAVVAIAFGQGCALTTDTIRIGYAVTKAAPLSGAEGVAVKVAMKDSRGMGDKVSVKKNGFGMEMAPILDPQAVATLQKAIELELKGRGFASGAGTVVNVEVTRFYSDFKMGLMVDAAADISMSVQVMGPNQAVLFSRTILAKGENNGALMAMGNEAKVALERALRAGMDQLLADKTFFDALIKSGQPAAAASVM